MVIFLNGNKGEATHGASARPSPRQDNPKFIKQSKQEACNRAITKRTRNKENTTKHKATRQRLSDHCTKKSNQQTSSFSTCSSSKKTKELVTSPAELPLKN